MMILAFNPQSVCRLFVFLSFMAISPLLFSQEGDPATPTETEETAVIDPSYGSPRATFKTLLENKKQALSEEPEAFEKALGCLDLAEIPPVSRVAVGKEAYYHLIQTLDRLEEVNLDEIPEDYADNTWVYRRATVTVAGNRYPVEIALHRKDLGVWQFTPKTIETIQNYFLSVKDRNVVQGVEAVETFRDRVFSKYPVLEKRFLFFSMWQWLGFVLIIFAATVLERIVSYLLKRQIEAKVHYEGFKSHLKASGSFIIPVRLLIYSGVLKFGLSWLFLPVSLINILNQTSILLLVVGLVWMATFIINVVASYFAAIAVKTENKFDDLLVPLLRKTSKVVVFSAGFLLLAQNLWDNVATILTGFGIGGLAVALAAKDTLANLFGSLTVLLDRPFQIGDWVQIGQIDGTVEEVGFRSTRVRTFYNSLITVPNNMLTSMSIDNYGARTYRRFKTTIGVEYGTDPQKLEAFCEGIRQLILKQPNTRKDYFHVYFNNFGASSLEILLYLFFKVPDWSTELAERHKILINILRLGKELGIGFAFPTQTVHLFQGTPQDDIELTQDAYLHGKALAESLSSQPITMKNPRSGAQSGDFPKDMKG